MRQINSFYSIFTKYTQNTPSASQGGMKEIWLYYNLPSTNFEHMREERECFILTVKTENEIVAV